MSLAARTLRPPCSKRAMICPIAFLATASGLMMVSVRSTGMRGSSSFPKLFFADDAGHRDAHVGGALHGGDAGGFHGLHLLCRGAFASRDDRPGMAHAPSGGRGLPADEADDGLGDVSLDEGRRLFLGGAADLSDHHDAFRLRCAL